ncbi:MAG: family 78 glycoside hydrolase catalytic domain [Suipraeoptans sp.]
MIRISQLLMNYEEELTGITSLPQISWKIESDRRNVVQRSYQLQLSEDQSFASIIYDSGIVTTSTSVQVMVEGVVIKSLRKYYIRVRIEDELEKSSWAVSSFITGLVDNNEWEAYFVTLESEKDAYNSKGTYLRKEFEVSKSVKEAFVCTTALGIYNFYLNGDKVGNDELTPGWTSYKKHLCYQTYDVTKYISEGNNAMGAIVAAGWYKGYVGFPDHVKKRNHYGKFTAFLAQLLVRYEDGSEEVFKTDEGWQGADAPVTFAEIYDGEIYDARNEISGWSNAGCLYENWSKVKKADYDFACLVGQGAAKVTEIEEVSAKEIFETPQGDTVVDFGQNMSAHILVTAEGNQGDVIKLECFETLDAKGNVYTANLRTAKQTMIYIFGDSKRISYSPSFTYMGFRYAKITEFPGEPKLDSFRAFTLHSKMDRTGKFVCSNPNINKLGENVLWSLKSNFVDIPTDCPQRDERMGWTGDAEIFCTTACYLMNTYNFWEKWLRDLIADQIENGGVPHVIPDIMYNNMHTDSMWYNGTHSGAAWADACTIIPWTLYLTYGDTIILERQYESMKKWIRFMEKNSEDYLWDYGVQLGDWVSLDAKEGSYFGATPEKLICAAYYALSTQIVAKTASILKRNDESSDYSNLHNKIVDKFQKTFWNEKGEMTVQTQTAHIVALYFQLVPEDYRENTVKGLLKLLKKAGGHLSTGFVGTPYVCYALSQNGYVNEAYDLILKEDYPSWLYEVKMGATTIWEHWDGLKPDGTMWSPNMNSFNHYAYGAVYDWIVKVSAGIEVDDKRPGYKHTIIYPRLGGGLKHMTGEYESIYGLVMSSWKDKEEQVELKVIIPPNTTATICLDQAKAVIVNDGLDFCRKNGIIHADAGSGEYTILYKK